MSQALDVIEITLAIGERRTVGVNYQPRQWKVYSTTTPWLSGFVAAAPGSTALSANVLKLLPNGQLTIPARGSQLSFNNLAGISITLVIEAR